MIQDQHNHVSCQTQFIAYEIIIVPDVEHILDTLIVSKLKHISAIIHFHSYIHQIMRSRKMFCYNISVIIIINDTY
jgi:hypothetical protein